MKTAEQQLVGREPELNRLAGWVREVAAGRGRTALIDGEPGIGKSALLQAAQRGAAALGCAVFAGAGEELGQAFPLLPLMQAFAFRPTLSEPAAAAEELLDHIDRLCARSPVLLVLDDLHWADAATVGLCHRLARSTAQRPLLLLGAVRPLPRRDDIQALRRAIPASSRVGLEPLPPAGVANLIAQLAGQPPGPELAKLAAGAAGNPLYVTELVDAFARAGRLTTTGRTVEVVGDHVPATLHEAISDRLDFLPDPVRDVLQAAALLGREFAVGDLALITGRRPAELAPVLVDARAAGVLDDTGVRMAFRHPLLRAALYDDVTAPMRAAWHRHAAYALHRAGAPADQVARQLLPAITGTSPEDAQVADWVADWLVESAPTLVSQASQAVVGLLRPAIAQLPGSDSRRHRLIAQLARALSYQGEYAEVEQLVSRTAPQVAEPALLVDLYDTLVNARVATRSGFEETLAELNHVLAEFQNLPQWVELRLRAAAARVEIECRPRDQVERSTRQWLAAALEAGDAMATGWLAIVLERILADRGEAQEPRELLDLGLSITDGAPDLVDLRLLFLLNLSVLEGNLDRFDESDRAMSEGRLLAERTGKRRRAVQFQRAQCQENLDFAKWDEALADAELPPDMDEPFDQHIVHHVAAIIAFHRGDTATAKRRLAAARRLEARIGPRAQWLMTTALEHEVAGDPGAALRVYANALREHGGQLLILAWLADAARLAAAQRDYETGAAAAAEAEALAAAAGHVPTRVATATYCRAVLTGHVQQLLAAADAYAQARRPLHRAKALEEAAYLLATAEDLAAARGPFLAALDLYTGLGAEWDIAQLRSRLGPLGLRPPTRRSKRPATGWDSLTAAEAKVADLAADGLSNPEIAERLVISRRTVETHLTKVLAKLQVRSRVELARAAAMRPTPRS